jgi:hypothetical protein
MGSMHSTTLVLVIFNHSLVEEAVQTLLQVVTVPRNLQIYNIKWLILHISLLSLIDLKFSLENSTKNIPNYRFLHNFVLVILN